jgi:hypothetical protein
MIGMGDSDKDRDKEMPQTRLTLATRKLPEGQAADGASTSVTFYWWSTGALLLYHLMLVRFSPPHGPDGHGTTPAG